MQTMTTLLASGVIPIINENDTVAVEEIRFGDNDMLSSLVASMVQAQMLVILSDVPGVLTGDPRKRPDGASDSADHESRSGDEGAGRRERGAAGKWRNGCQLKGRTAGGARESR